MPRKKSATLLSPPSINEKMKMVNESFSFSQEELFENLSENEKKNLLSNCSLIFCNPAFQRICNDVYTREIVRAVETSVSFEDFVERRGFLLGLKCLGDTIKGFHLEYLNSMRREESFDRQEII